MNLTDSAMLSDGPVSPPPSAFCRGQPVDTILARLYGHLSITQSDRDQLSGSVGATSAHRLGADLGDDGEASCRFLVSGWACRVRESPWGGRQILDFVLPGDPIGLSMGRAGGGLYRVVALTRGSSVDAMALRDMARSRTDDLDWTRFILACQRNEQARASRLHDHTVRLGAPTATQGMIHLLLELRARMAEIGELEEGSFPMPLSQEILSDALGITVTQVYRILVQLRRDSFITIGTGRLKIPDPSALANAARIESWRT